MALGDVLFNIIFYDEPNGWSITALCICFINFALPMTYINRKIFTLDEKHKIQSESPDYTKEYNIARVQFTFEYDRLNPITQKKAVEDWVKFIEKKNRDGESIGSIIDLDDERIASHISIDCILILFVIVHCSTCLI